MSLTRIEYDIGTGERTIIDVTAYKNEFGDVLVIDSIDPEPEGFQPFDPHEEELTKE